MGAFPITMTLLALYFIPACVAWSRNHHNATAIFALNLLAGWTVIGWIVALVWALTSRPPATPPPPPAQ